jgi:tetratricopeptide (TPR) repeat protein
MSEDYQSLSSTGMKYYHKKDYALAADYFSRAAEGAKESQQTEDEAEILNNLSVAHLKAGKPQEAYDAALGTDKVFAEHNDIKRQAMAMGNIAGALEDLKEYSQAMEIYNQALELLKGKEFNDIRSALFRRKSEVQRKMGNNYQAVAALDSSLDEKPSRNLNDKFLKRIMDSFFMRKK